jgi:hypothetical protein
VTDPEVTHRGKLMTTPGTVRTPHHSFRIPERLYRDALAAARRNGEPLTDVVRRALRDYVKASRGGGAA